MYIPKRAYKEINRRLEEGQTYIDSIKYTAYSHGLEPVELRKAYETRSHRLEVLDNLAVAIGMLLILSIPVSAFLFRG